MFHHFAFLLSQFCQLPISTSRTLQKADQPKTKSTRPNYLTRWTTLYCRQEDSSNLAEGEANEEPNRERLHKALKLLQATLVFLTCPLLLALWYSWLTIKAIRKGDDVFMEKYHCTRRIRSLRVVAENAPQMFLQLYIVIIRWRGQGT